MKFIYCFSEDLKEKMMLNGYEYMNKVKYKGKEAFLFANNSNKLTFTNGEVVITNKLTFEGR